MFKAFILAIRIAWEVLVSLHDLAIISAIIVFVFLLYQCLKNKDSLLNSLGTAMIMAVIAWVVTCIVIYVVALALHSLIWLALTVAAIAVAIMLFD